MNEKSPAGCCPSHEGLKHPAGLLISKRRAVWLPRSFANRALIERHAGGKYTSILIFSPTAHFLPNPVNKTQQVIMVFIRYAIGGALAFFAFILLLTGQFFMAFFWGFSSALLFPRTLKYLEKKAGQRLLSWQKNVLVAISFLLGVATFNAPASSKSKPLPVAPLAPVTVRDTVFIRDTVKIKESVTVAKASKKTPKGEGSTTANTIAPAPQQYYTPPPTVTRKEKRKSRSGGCSYNGNPLYVGSRGGCYYLTASGRKEYVDRSYCSGCN